MHIPGPHNDHHPAAIAHPALTAYLVFSICSFVVLRNIAAQTGNVLGFATDISVDRLLSLTNEKRVNSGLSELTYNAQLSAAAAGKAQDMFHKGYWAHFGPNKESPWMFILGAGYSYEAAGENLAKNYVTSGDVVDAWMNSPTHRENLLKPSFKDVGFAVVNGTLSGEETTLVVQMFGSKSMYQPPTPTSVPPTPIPTQIVVQNTIPTLIPTVTPPADDLVQVAAAANPDSAPIQTTPTPVNTDLAKITQFATPPASAIAPKLDLYPYFKTIIAALVAFLVAAFVVDLYHLSDDQHLAHRGKHLAHIIFLIAILISMFFLGRGSVI